VSFCLDARSRSNLARIASATDLTACNQVINAGDGAVLQADLDCPGSGTCFDQTPCTTDADCSVGSCDYESGITRQKGATLQLNGRSLTNDGYLYCAAACSVAASLRTAT